MLLKHGTVFYMNGYDGSEFDFYVNNRTCEFVSFYRKPTRRFFDVYVSCNGIFRGRVYLDVGDDVGIAVEQWYVNPVELAEFIRVMQIFADDLGKWEYNIEEGAKEFARALQLYADNLKKWDCNIEEIVFKTRK